MGSLTIGLGITDLVIRWLYPRIAYKPYEDSILGWTSRAYNAIENPISSGSQQFRKSTRTLVLGDSFLITTSITKTIFPTFLEQMSRGKIEVRTLATEGWGNDQEFIAFQQKRLQWRPDIVILAFCSLNDISNNVSAIRPNSANPSSLGRGIPKPYFCPAG